jgi:hypothetical protein
LDLLIFKIFKSYLNNPIIGVEDKRELEDVDGFGEVKEKIFQMSFRIMYKIVCKIETCIHDFDNVFFTMHLVPL